MREVYDAPVPKGRGCPACNTLITTGKIRKMAAGPYLMQWLHNECALRLIDQLARSQSSK